MCRSSRLCLRLAKNRSADPKRTSSESSCWDRWLSLERVGRQTIPKQTCILLLWLLLCIGVERAKKAWLLLLIGGR